MRVGGLQLAYLRAEGLLPEHRLLDIGCGSLRLGARAVAYLEPGRYQGTDLNESLLDAGYREEILPAGLEAKLERSALVEDGEFAFPNIEAGLDFAIATSVFTHLPLNHLRLCLARLAPLMAQEGRFYFTVFEPTPDTAAEASCRQSETVTTHPHKDPYHYQRADLDHAARGLGWQLEGPMEWGHPRNQKMMRATLG